MAEERKILFISNGYGEDKIAAHIAQEIKRQFSTAKVAGFPTVGSGRFYSELGILLAGRGLEMPSEGFVRSLRDLINDLRSGLLRKTIRMGYTIKKVSKGYDFLVVTGDPFLLLYTSLFTRFGRLKKIFIGTLQSEWYDSKKPFLLHYSGIERLWLRLFSSLIIVRDTKTSDYLRSKGLSYSKSLGNPMMDCFSIQKKNIFPKDRTVIGILPGSKQEAYDNFGNIIKTVKELSRISGNRRNYLFAVAISPNLDINNLVKMYNLIEDHEIERPNSFSVYEIDDIDIFLLISNSSFGNIIYESKAVIGLSGTGNEQAVGLGKPVFAFWGKGPQMTEKFLVAQNWLLGISLFVFPPDPAEIAKKIDEVLDDKTLIKQIEENGKLRMNGIGSVERIASEIGEYVMKNMNKLGNI